MVLQDVILHKTDKWGIKNENFLNVPSFSKKLIFQTYVYVIWAIDIHRFIYFGTQAYNFEIDLLENDITMTFNSLKSLIFFLNRQFFIFFIQI